MELENGGLETVVSISVMVVQGRSTRLTLQRLS